MLIALRAPCASCGGTDGYTVEKNGQDVARCSGCDTYQYNAPRIETGRAVRTLSSRPGLTPSARARVFDIHDNRCIVCGRTSPDVQLDLEHLISREDADRHGFLDELIDSEWNLAPMCAECNSGKRTLGSASVRLMYRVLLIKATPK